MNITIKEGNLGMMLQILLIEARVTSSVVSHIMITALIYQRNSPSGLVPRPRPKNGITFCVVSFRNLIGFSKCREVMVDRKYMETLPGPFPNFLGGAWGQGY